MYYIKKFYNIVDLCLRLSSDFKDFLGFIVEGIFKIEHAVNLNVSKLKYSIVSPFVQKV